MRISSISCLLKARESIELQSKNIQRRRPMEANLRRDAAARQRRRYSDGKLTDEHSSMPQPPHKKGISGCNFGSLANSVRESHGFASRSHDRFAFIDLLAAARRRLTAAKDIYVENRRWSNTG